jgi:acyl-CoA synthetase (AMP-forming)/AMP-acid ligase II
MILGDGSRATGSVTLDALFRRAGVRNAHAPALIDPPNRARVTDGAPRTLTFAQADRAIAAFAATLRGLGLHTDAVVGLQLPNTVESVIALLGVLRAGMIAAPLPLLWRRRDLVEALGRAGAKAFVTAGRIGACAHAELAMEVAAELFPIRQIAAFGDGLPDGVVPLDDIFAGTAGELPPQRTTNAAAHVAAWTFAGGAEGPVPVAHDHAELIAAGESVLHAAAPAVDAPLLSTLPLCSYAGLSVTLMPWLLGGGALHLHHGFDAEVFAAQAAALGAGMIAVPGSPLRPLAALAARGATMLAVWRNGSGLAVSAPCRNAVDVACIGDAAVTAAARDEDGLPDRALVAQARAAGGGDIVVGGYPFRQSALDAAVLAIDPRATVAALPDAALGQRLAGHAADPAAVAARLTQAGVNPLIAGAFRPRGAAAI